MQRAGVIDQPDIYFLKDGERVSRWVKRLTHEFATAADVLWSCARALCGEKQSLSHFRSARATGYPDSLFKQCPLPPLLVDKHFMQEQTRRNESLPKVGKGSRFYTNLRSGNDFIYRRPTLLKWDQLYFPFTTLTINPAVKNLERSFATLIMAEKRQELCQMTILNSHW